MQAIMLIIHFLLVCISIGPHEVETIIILDRTSVFDPNMQGSEKEKLERQEMLLPLAIRC